MKLKHLLEQRRLEADLNQAKIYDTIQQLTDELDECAIEYTTRPSLGRVYIYHNGGDGVIYVDCLTGLYRIISGNTWFKGDLEEALRGIARLLVP